MPRSGVNWPCCGRRCEVACKLTNDNRLFLIQLYRWFPSILKVITHRPRLGSDYGYFGNLPADKIPPFVAVLGPWPARATILVRGQQFLRRMLALCKIGVCSGG